MSTWSPQPCAREVNLQRQLASIKTFILFPYLMGGFLLQAVFTAARDNNCEILSEYLGNGCDAMLVDNNGWTLLHWAAAGNAIEAAQVFGSLLLHKQACAATLYHDCLFCQSTHTLAILL